MIEFHRDEDFLHYSRDDTILEVLGVLDKDRIVDLEKELAEVQSPHLEHPLV